jgi:hypothetical protein
MSEEARHDAVGSALDRFGPPFQAELKKRDDEIARLRKERESVIERVHGFLGWAYAHSEMSLARGVDALIEAVENHVKLHAERDVGEKTFTEENARLREVAALLADRDCERIDDEPCLPCMAGELVGWPAKCPACNDEGCDPCGAVSARDCICPAEGCDHEWVSLHKPPTIIGGEGCMKCMTIRPAAPPEEPSNA